MLSNKPGKKINKYVSDYVVFDLETTGISAESDEVVEISAVKVKDGVAVEEFGTLVNPERPMPISASLVNGITDEMLKDAPVFQDVLADFLKFAGDNVLVGHNIHTFDMKFIYRDSKKFYGKIPDNDYIDTLTLARQYISGLSRYRLVDLAEHYGISPEGAHRALNDCYMNQRVFEALGREIQNADISKFRKCPRCGQILKKRSGRFGEFWGCTGYPECRYTENV